MMNSSLGHLDTTENYFEYNNTNDSYEYEEGIYPSYLETFALVDITFIICCIGFVGNGYIIWLLGFQIKTNSFTTFILNLAVADFGFLASIVIYYIDQFARFQERKIFYHLCAFVSHMMYINAIFLLTAISIDRCVAVLFPIWHHCSRPKKLSSSICVLLWISSFLMSGSMRIMLLTNVFENYNLFGLYFLLLAIICLPLITLSTAILFFKMCRKSNQKNQGRLLLMILITLLCFLILAFPLNIFVLIFNFFNIPALSYLRYWEAGMIMCFCLNSSINPVIYFLVGRKKGTRTKQSMKVILQKVFKEGEATGRR
ncbi:mas-related G-protein coupled receptor member H-like [Erythrolamprus reginae]|uniref:mas-related G-protein coupled receptor member H-like n=1 Tax=Erythrolamprus reginae TaxID=121349 RepID=UPI00396C4EF9